MNYNVAGQTEYALNCYQLIHPFYQDHFGWHHIRFLVYSNLGFKLTDFREQQVINDFFKNYIKLCAEVEDQVQQRQYMIVCLECIQQFLRKNNAPIESKQKDLIQFADPLNQAKQAG